MGIHTFQNFASFFRVSSGFLKKKATILENIGICTQICVLSK
jgi:hypothetical protein